MTRGNILTEEEIARLAALPEKQRDYAVKIYAAREKKKSTAYILWIVFALVLKCVIILTVGSDCDLIVHNCILF